MRIFGPRRKCGFCSLAYPADRAACPECGLPADGDFEKWTPPPSSAAKAKKGVRTTECAHCGAKFDARRPACPECGSDEQTGWKSADDQDHDGAGIPDTFDEDDYREAVAELHPTRPDLWSPRQRKMLIVGLIIVATFVLPVLVLLYQALEPF